MENIELRKKKEAEFHDKLRSDELKSKEDDFRFLTSNKKFYSITRKSVKFTEDWLSRRCKNKTTLDYCCGDGAITIFLAKNGAARSVGIDISPVSIENSKKKAFDEGVDKNTSFLVMDAEKLEFGNDHFDIIICSGVLHHLNMENAYKEMARALKPDGEIICIEPLAYNPIFQLYRKKTLHLRTQWEADHILCKKDIKLAGKYFEGIETIFFHLTTLAAVPFRNLPGFNFLLGILEGLDSALLKLPILKWWAWQIIFVLSRPKDKDI